MKPRLIILSDLWGKAKSGWTKEYINLLSPSFDVTFYDCCELGNIDISDYTQENLHKQFVDGGIDTAVDNLLEQEKESVIVLGFSVGGSVAWKAALKGLNIERLFTVSSTRLRLETEKPKCYIKDFYGEKDENLPTDEWFETHNMNEYVFAKQGHDLFKIPKCIRKITSEILRFVPDAEQPNNPLHGVRLKDILEYLVDEYGWEELGSRINIRCFNSDPSIGSSLKFLRRTPWARNKVEQLYLQSLRR